MKFLIFAVVAFLALRWLRERIPEKTNGPSLRTERKKKLDEKKRQYASRASNPYQAVSIQHGAGACQSVLSVGKRRFLVADAPLTPLRGCTEEHCNCRYLHHRDRRRNDGGRRAIASARRLHDGNGDRRKGLGRRKDDADSYAFL